MKKEIVKVKRISKQAELIKKELTKINKLNKVFNKATPAEKRIIIAKDVIAQIEAGKYIPIKGSYFEANCDLKEGDELQNILIKPKTKCTVCELGGLFTSVIRINDNFKIREDESDVELSDISKELTKYFSEKQLVLIETAFESFNDSHHKKSDIPGLLGDRVKISLRKLDQIQKDLFLDKLKQARGYRKRYNLEKPINKNPYSWWDSYGSQSSDYMKYERYHLKLVKENDKNTMIKICKNIINNKGTFRPER